MSVKMKLVFTIVLLLVVVAEVRPLKLFKKVSYKKGAHEPKLVYLQPIYHHPHPAYHHKPAYLPQPAYPQSAYSQAAYPIPANSQPAYPQPAYPQPAYPQPAYLSYAPAFHHIHDAQKGTTKGSFHIKAPFHFIEKVFWRAAHKKVAKLSRKLPIILKLLAKKKAKFEEDTNEYESEEYGAYTAPRQPTYRPLESYETFDAHSKELEVFVQPSHSKHVPVDSNESYDSHSDEVEMDVAPNQFKYIPVASSDPSYGRQSEENKLYVAPTQSTHVPVDFNQSDNDHSDEIKITAASLRVKYVFVDSEESYESDSEKNGVYVTPIKPADVPVESKQSNVNQSEQRVVHVSAPTQVPLESSRSHRSNSDENHDKNNNSEKKNVAVAPVQPTYQSRKSNIPGKDNSEVKSKPHISDKVKKENLQETPIDMGKLSAKLEKLSLADLPIETLKNMATLLSSGEKLPTEPIPNHSQATLSEMSSIELLEQLFSVEDVSD